jgi:hypothetical protein
VLGLPGSHQVGRFGTLVAAEYQLRIYDTNGQQQAITTEWNSLYFFNRSNDFGYHTISIDAADPRLQYFTTDAIIQVLRRERSAGVLWYQEYLGFHRTSEIQVTDRGNRLFYSIGRSVVDLLARRVIMFRPGDDVLGGPADGGAIEGPADDVMKSYVYYNAGPQALTAVGRMTDGVTLGLSVSANTSQADNWAGSRHYRNLLDVLKEISDAKSVDFDVVWTGGQRFEFRTYFPQRGTDRSGAGTAAPVVFSLEHANMSAPYYTVSRVNEVTKVVVLGQGEGTDRQFVVRHNVPEEIISPWNVIEFSHDARNETTISALNDLGDAHLLDKGPDSHLSFQTLQSPASVYGRDYFVGDLVVASFAGVTEPRKVSGVEVTMANGREDIRVHFGGE